ncbi:MAG TPA: TonB-dependent receptor [Sphingomonas sp.]|nr:TonB-dependent receptor [Sphingomonas sp.]
MTSLRLTAVFLMGASSLAFSSAAFGQEANAPAGASPPAAAPAEAGEIIVTAQRRSENAQRTPIALTVVTAAALEKQNISEVNDLQRITPSMTVQEVGLTKYVNIRGIGLNASQPGLSTGVAYHIDGLFARELGLQTPYYDIARVEVLRGPQGTLAGQNATGGAIFVVSQTPKFGDTSGHAEFSYGNYDHYTAEAALNVPISNVLAARVASYVESRNSYTTNLITPGSSSKTSFQPGNLSRVATRLTLDYKPSNAFEVILRGEFFNLRTDGIARKPLTDPIADAYTTSTDVNAKADTTSRRLSAEVKIQLTDGIQLRSLTGYQYNRINNVYDQDGTSAVTPASRQAIVQPAFSQEFNLISTGGGPAQWVVGAYYFELTKLSKGFFNNGAIEINGVPRTRNEAVFGQLTYKVTDNVQLIGGIRYNKDKDWGKGTLALLFLPDRPVNPFDSAAKTDAWTGKLGANVEINPNHNLYVTASKGYRAGGTNFGGAPSFGKETIYNYEAGLKSAFLDRHIRTQLSGYYDVYKGVQVNTINPLTHLEGIVNAGDDKFWGVEGQVQATFGGLSIDGSAAYLHSKLDPVALVDPLGATTPVQIGGRPLPLSPHWTGSIGAEYRAELGNGDSITPRAQYSYIGQQWASVFQRSFERLRPFRQWEARLTYEHDNISVAAYATNVSNQTYVAGIEDSAYRIYGPPRQYGIKVGYSF